MAEGLIYPSGEAPTIGHFRTVIDGYRWGNVKVGAPLDTVNVWAIDDHDGVLLVDAGLDTPQARQAWLSMLAVLASEGRVPHRLVLTHHHPDHAGLAGWLASVIDSPVAMTAGADVAACILDEELRSGATEGDVVFWRANGWSEAEIEAEYPVLYDDFRHMCGPLPDRVEVIADGGLIELGTTRLRVLETGGHASGHACLWDEQAGVLIGGDQVLPGITSGLSVLAREPDADLLGDWLRSAERLSELPRSTLVLPSHGRPFLGLHNRIQALREQYERRLDRVVAHLASPETTAGRFAAVFSRPPEGPVRLIMTGETRAYLNRLERDGRVRREDRGGVLYWEAAL